MKAYLHSARIAPKKANLIAQMVRGMPVAGALHALSRTHKKGARLIEELLKSAVANAEHNDKQDATHLVIKTIVVNQGMAYRRGVPMARGRVRPMSKFMSHITLTLGIGDHADEKETKKGKKAAKTSQTAKNTVKTSGTKKSPKAKEDSSSGSSASSESSASTAS